MKQILLRRREFFGAIGLGAASLMFDLTPAHSGQVPRIGVLWHASNAQEESVPLTAMRQGFADLSYIEGQTIILENRFPAEQPDRFRSMAEELVAQNLDVLVGVTLPAALALKRATGKTPIVFVGIPDPIGVGLVDNLARPSGNVTGLSVMTVELIGKQLELLHEISPKLRRIGLLMNASSPEGESRYIKTAQVAAVQLGLAIVPIEVRANDDIEQVLSAVGSDQIDAVVMTQDGVFFRQHQRISKWALHAKLPMIVFARNIVEGGALLSYAPSLTGGQRRVAYFVDKILKGAKPADLPVEQPTKIEFVINRKTAKALGIDIPQALLAQADEVIE